MTARFVIQFVRFLLPLAAVLVGVNYYGDASNLYTEGYEKAIADILLSGRHATDLSEVNDRRLQIEVVEQRTWGPQVAIIGSSRTLLINEGHFYPSSTFNHSVYAATWFDLNGMFGLLLARGQLPDTLVLGLDPWTFNPGHVHAFTHTWLSLLPADSLPADAQVRMEAWDRWSNLLSPSYFQASLKEIPKRLTGTDQPIPVNTRYNAHRTRCSDGSLTYDPVFASSDSMQITERIKLFLDGTLYGMNGYHSTDKVGVEAVQTILLEARRHGVYPVVFFPPVAPKVYQRIANDYPLALLNEARLRDWCIQQGVEVRGSSNPNDYGLSFRHFYDGIHMNEEGVARFFEVRKSVR